MAHFRTLFDPSQYLSAADLGGKDATVQIEKVTGGQVIGSAGRKARKPIATFAGKTKKLALNVTNCKTIAKMYGTADYEKWAGKWVTLYGAQTQLEGEVVDCVRIRPKVPTVPNVSKQTAAPDPEPEHGEAEGGEA